jgi:Flp pilus assembly protein TadG
MTTAQSTAKWRRVLFPLARKWRQGAADERGVSLIELSLVLFMSLVIVAGTVDLAGAFGNYIILLNSAREGTRVYAKLPCTVGGGSTIVARVEDAVAAESAGSAIDLGEVEIILSPNPASGCPAAGSTVRVIVTLPYATTFGDLVGGPVFTIEASSAMATTE